MIVYQSDKRKFLQDSDNREIEEVTHARCEPSPEGTSVKGIALAQDISEKHGSGSTSRGHSSRRWNRSRVRLAANFKTMRLVACAAAAR